MNGQVKKTIFKLKICTGFELFWDKFPSIEEEKSFLREYLASFQGKSTQEISDQQIHHLWIEVEKFTLASHFWWGSWALVQALVSDKDFDYLEYGIQRFQLYFKEKQQKLSQT